jgi:hypothetical protein
VRDNGGWEHRAQCQRRGAATSTCVSRAACVSCATCACATSRHRCSRHSGNRSVLPPYGHRPDPLPGTEDPIARGHPRTGRYTGGRPLHRRGLPTPGQDGRRRSTGHVQHAAPEREATSNASRPEDLHHGDDARRNRRVHPISDRQEPLDQGPALPETLRSRPDQMLRHRIFVVAPIAAGLLFAAAFSIGRLTAEKDRVDSAAPGVTVFAPARLNVQKPASLSGATVPALRVVRRPVSARTPEHAGTPPVASPGPSTSQPTSPSVSPGRPQVVTPPPSKPKPLPPVRPPPEPQ